VSTSVPKPDGSGRAIGTVLAGPALESIKAGKNYYGEVPILGTPGR
jgi:Cache 3/Cache 2 fusion domain